MTFNGILQIVIFLILLVLLVKPLGGYMARVYQGQPTWLERLLAPLERFIYRLIRIDPVQEMDWKAYTTSFLVFSILGIIFLYLLQRVQGFLPLNPREFGAVPVPLAINTAISFVTNTNWQNYGGETTMSYLTQMAGLTVQNFLSAASGMAILVALIRGLARHSAKTIGNYWVDITRSVLYILAPLAILLSLILVSQGAVQTLKDYPISALLQPAVDANGAAVNEQVLAVGPVASQVAIKHLGTNGGGFFNANSAHPFESPTPLTDLILVLSETIIAAALTYTYGKMVGDTRQGWALLSAMLIILIIGIFGAYWAESVSNPAFQGAGIDQTASNLNPGGNMEGKEVRFGIASSARFAAATTATSTGAVNSMHSSFMPLGGLVPLLLIQLGEVVLGGVGSGMYGMLSFVIIAVFIAGLMVGRTPEYLGKKVEAFEMKMAALVILIMPVTVLGMTAVASITTTGTASILNTGPHGLSEILYAYSSQVNNNGSAFAGLSGNTWFYNLTGGLGMLIGRLWLAIPILAIAGSMIVKKKTPASAGTLPTYTPLFVVWLTVIILMVGALNFLPALALGPIVEHLRLFL